MATDASGWGSNLKPAVSSKMAEGDCCSLTMQANAFYLLFIFDVNYLILVQIPWYTDKYNLLTKDVTM